MKNKELLQKCYEKLLELCPSDSLTVLVKRKLEGKTYILKEKTKAKRKTKKDPRRVCREAAIRWVEEAKSLEGDLLKRLKIAKSFDNVGFVEAIMLAPVNARKLLKRDRKRNPDKWLYSDMELFKLSFVRGVGERKVHDSENKED